MTDSDTPAPDSAWHDAITLRTSRRTYDRALLDAAVVGRFEDLCERYENHVFGARCMIVNAVADSVFTGVVGGYGAVTGAPAFAALIGREGVEVGIGYLGEALILEAAAAGVDTCWIAGSFSRKAVGPHVRLAAGERVHAVTPLGHAVSRQRGAEWAMRTMVRSSGRKPLDVIAPGSEAWPPWAMQAARAVRPAPSGANGQPWRLRMDGDALVVATAPKAYWTAPMDCGIAMLHAELGALQVGVRGSWELLEAPDVARFTPRT